MRRGAARVVALTISVLVLLGAAPAGASVGTATRAADAPVARRVLVFTMPYVSWSDLDRVRLPNLERFIARAAVAGLSTRVDQFATPLADGYATIGAGTRTVSDPTTDGDGRMVDEPFGIATAGDAYTQRTGRAATSAIVQPGIMPILDANNRLHYDTRVGALADALARGGIGRAVVANADGSEPDAARSSLDATLPPAFQRQAVLGLMDHLGRVSSGRVDRGLLEQDPAAPFGVRLDLAQVAGAFADAWRGRAVVLVEASDLVRATRARPYANARRRREQLDAALRRSDALFGRLLQQVDLSRDTVIMAGPAHRPGHRTLTPIAIRGPGFEPGLLRSATTRRAGFVTIRDVAPTILETLDVPRPSSMEGTPADVGSTGGTSASRLHFLERADAVAQFRDARIGEVFGLLDGAVLFTLLATFLAMWSRRASFWRPVAQFLALGSIGLLSSAFLVRLFPLDRAGVVAYYTVLIAIGASISIGCLAIARRRPLDGLLVGVLVPVALLTVDAFRGAPLVLGSVLGYSPIEGSRFAGFGNPAYAAYSSAALLAAVLLAHRIGGRRGLAVAGSLLALAIVVDVAPMLGADVGGILSMVPAYALTYAILRGWRVRVRTVLAGLAAMAAVLVVATAVDLARPSDQRTHLGRLVESVRDKGLGHFVDVAQRKLGANLASMGHSYLGLAVLFAVVAWLVLQRRDPGRIDAVLRAVPTWRAGCLGFAVLAVLGFALNDSGITIPGIMLVVFVGAWSHLLVSIPSDDALAGATPVGAPRAATEEPVPA